jgi:hypothetical protein
MLSCVPNQYPPRKIPVHLAYLDDSQQAGSLAMFGAVVIPHGEFGFAERMHSIAVEQLFRSDEIEEKFQEFHAFELFKGEGAFRGIDKTKRHEAIRVLLSTMQYYRLPFIYAAIDEKKLAKSAAAQGLFETADPLIPAFKLCALGVEIWAQNHHSQDCAGRIRIDYRDQYLFVIDETNDQALKKRLRNSYRLLRAARPYIGIVQNRLWHCHDAMYFGDSRDSVGIQLADLCTYFTQRRLLKRDVSAKDEADEFFEMFAPYAICAKPEPEWSEYRDLLLAHDSSPYNSRHYGHDT